jgi:steroid delta-isomerase-like uncharacterized protein
MTKAEVEALVRRWAFEAVAGGKLEVFDELLDEGVRDLSGATPSIGRETFKARAAAVQKAFGDLEIHIDELIIDGDRIAWRWTMSGTHIGPFLNVPPTGRRAQLRGVNFQRLEGGRVLEHWTLVDALGLRDQLTR